MIAEPTPQIEDTVADDGAVRVAPRRRKADELH